MYSRIKQHFHDQTKCDLKIHHEWYRLYVQHIATNKRMKNETRAKHKLLVKRTKSLNLIENSRNRLSVAEQREKEKFDARIKSLHHQMNGIESIRKEQQAQQSILEQKEFEQLQLKERDEKNKWNEYRNEQKMQLSGYYKDKISKLQIIKSEQQRQRQIDLIRKREKGKINMKRVVYRENKRGEKV